MKIKLQIVRFMPKELEPATLYVSYEFGTAAHLCACGCGSKIRTPLDVTEWSVEETREGPSLWPSVGNWQLPCKSHYLITRGQIVWANRWTEKQIIRGRKQEEMRREAYYTEMSYRRKGAFNKALRWIKAVLRK